MDKSCCDLGMTLPCLLFVVFFHLLNPNSNSTKLSKLHNFTKFKIILGGLKYNRIEIVASPETGWA